MSNQMGMPNNMPPQMQGRTPGAAQGQGANPGSQPNGAAPIGQMAQGQVPQHSQWGNMQMSAVPGGMPPSPAFNGQMMPMQQ